MNEQQVIDKLCFESGKDDQFGFSEKECLSSYLHRSTDLDLRVSWKFAAYNSVTGTPALFLNGVQAAETPLKVEDWAALTRSFLLFPKEQSK